MESNTTFSVIKNEWEMFMRMKIATVAIGTLLVAGLPQAYAAETLNFTMGGISGSVYALGVQVSEQLRKQGGYTVNVKAGGAQGNVLLVDRNRAQVGHTSSGLAAAALAGIEPYKEKAGNVLGIAKVMDSTFQIVVLQKAPIDSLQELKEKKYPLKIAVGPRGRENELLTRRILEANGITYDDITGWGGRVEFVEIGDAGSLIRDGHLEAVTMLSGIPYPPISEINASRPIKILSLNDETIATLGEKYGYTPASVAAGAYKDVNQEARTVAGGVILMVNKDISDETVFRMTEIMCSDEGRENIGNLSGSIKEYLRSAKDCATGVGIPLHPGAEAWYKKQGVLP